MSTSSAMTVADFNQQLMDGTLKEGVIYAIKTGSRGITIAPWDTPDSRRHNIIALTSGDKRYLILDDNNCAQNYTVDQGATVGYVRDENEEVESVVFAWNRQSANLPVKLIEQQKLDDKLLNNFRVYGYHDYNMRTNKGSVRDDNFKRLSDEPTGRFFTYLGLELEVCGLNHDSKIRNLMEKRSNKDLYQSFDVSTDGSLNGNGLEFVSVPMSLAYLKANRAIFDKFYQWVDSEGMTFRGASMHIHFDRRMFERTAFLDTSSFELSKRNLADRLITNAFKGSYGGLERVNILLGRAETNYCSTRNSFRQCVNNGSDHSAWITSSDKTIEFRRYGANLNFDDLLNKAEFTLQLVKIIDAGVRDNVLVRLIEKKIEMLIWDFYIRKLRIVLAHRKVAHSDYSGIFVWWGEMTEKALTNDLASETENYNTALNTFITDISDGKYKVETPAPSAVSKKSGTITLDELLSQYDTARETVDF